MEERKKERRAQLRRPVDRHYLPVCRGMSEFEGGREISVEQSGVSGDRAQTLPNRSLPRPIVVCASFICWWLQPPAVEAITTRRQITSSLSTPATYDQLTNVRAPPKVNKQVNCCCWFACWYAYSPMHTHTLTHWLVCACQSDTGRHNG